MSIYKLIIFDLDDTLFDYQETEKYAILMACEKLSISFKGDLYSLYKKANNTTRKEYNKLTSKNIYDFREARARTFFSLINVEATNTKDFIKEYLKYSINGVLIEGVKETLETLKGILMVVATNGTNFPRKNKLDNSQISKYFDAFFSSENLELEKPNPKFFLKIVKQYNVPKEAVLIVGDNYSTDILGAVKLGIDSCLFNYRHKKLSEILPKNVYIIESFNELIGIINSKSYE